ncbi:MAG: presenilin family intramembrane aspartyl protease [Candidatus Micrarchaeota archaeon]|nr:presenilin family intramembrane aspartyl protease [Candidatus Micrarchaeota archaeon]
MDLKMQLFFVYAYTIIFSALLGAMLISISLVAPQIWSDVVPNVSTSGPIEDGLIIFLYMMIGAVGFVVINKLGLVKYAIRAVELLSILGCFSIASIIILQYLGLNDLESSIIGYTIGLVFLARRMLMPMEMNNMYGMVVSAVIGALFGVMLSMEAIILFGILMALYDIIAVFVTKHMIDIAKAVVSSNLSMIVTVSRGNAKPDFGEKKDIQKARRLDLGTGDLFIASLFVVCSLKFSLLLFLIMILFSFLGFFATMKLLETMRRPIPALPTIVGSLLIGYAFYFGISMAFHGLKALVF